jgi:hypothetical protein
VNIGVAHEIQLTDFEGSLLTRQTVTLAKEEARAIRAAARALRGKRFRMTVRCDACFEAGRGDGMRGEINARYIALECRCRFLRFNGETP